jgi:two-component system CheB/CheR fusion protein
MKRVKEHGGLTMAQSPQEAEYQDMPANAIATGLVDLVLPVAEMPRRLADYEERLRRDVVGLAPVTPGEEAEALHEVVTLLRLRTGQDFSNYKLATVRRRIERRIGVRGLQSLAEYARLIRDQPDEAIALMRELLISVTNFFREPAAFARLEERVVPRLFESKTNMDQLRVWCAGCATGEEAYSIAMLFFEHAATRPDPPMVQIFATDLDEQAITIGREGLYTEAEVADVTPERLRRFFQQETGGYRVRRELREMVLFAHHNAIKDPPFAHLDLIACRNLLIYLNRSVQERLIETFHFALRPGGYLFLGAAETPDSGAALFAAIDKEAHIYESRSATTTRLPLPLSERPIHTISASTLPRPEARVSERIPPGELHLRLLEQFAPPSVIVTDDHTVVHMSDRVGRFMAIPGGEPSRDVLRMVHPDLRPDLRNALHRAMHQRRVMEVDGAHLPGRDGDILVKITVRPVLRDGSPASGYFIILFEEQGIAAEPDTAVRVTGVAATGSTHLDEELQRVRDQLRVTIEQYETQAEEAKASNEELQAMNEELRSAAEELETSKEELQSLNEELNTVNQELKIKIDELRLTNNDFQNLINATDIGTIFLDKALCVKLSTPRAREIFNLLPSDSGRQLSDITSRLDYAGLHDDARQVLDRLQPIEREVPSRDGRWYLARLLPYRTLDDRIEGIALTFVDITSRRQAEDGVRRSEERLRLLIDRAVDYAILTMTTDGTIDSWNSGAERTFGYLAAEVVGQPFDILFTPEDRATGVPGEQQSVARAKGRADDERWYLRKDGSRFYASGLTIALGDAQGFAKITRDLTSPRRSEQALEEARANLEDQVRQRIVDLTAELSDRAEAQDRTTILLRKVVTAQENERARIARDLHDQFGQQLTALRLALERHRSRCATPDAQGDMDRALTAASELDTAVDFLAWELRPAALDDLGLAAALPRYTDEWSAHYGIAVRFEAAGYRGGMLSAEAEIAFYRIAQEALNNVLKHAHAARVDILLEARDSSVVMVIEDDGIGFDQGDRDLLDNGIGLAGMRERAALIGGALDIESAPGKGTTLFVRAPPAAAVGEQV